MRDGCGARSRACDEPRHGTASRARRWVLFEHPGAWGAEVLDDGTLPEHLAAALRRFARDLPARVLLLRRAPGVARVAPERALFAGVTTPDGGWLERLSLRTADELVDLDLSGLSTGGSVGGEPVAAPIYLVCTNGKHDACCAEYGRPVVDVLAPRLGDRLWESTHVGGDRFAGNLVCLPQGHYYGHLDAATAPAVVAAHDAGRLSLDHWRGRSSLPFPAQSAEVLARRRLGLDHEDDLTATRVTHDGSRVSVDLRRRDGSTWTAVVEVSAARAVRALTCGGSHGRPPVHTLVSLDPR